MFRVNLRHSGDRAECRQWAGQILGQARASNKINPCGDLTPWQLNEVLDYLSRHESKDKEINTFILCHLQLKKRTLREGWDSLTLEERQRRLQLLWSPEEYETIRAVEQHLRELCDGDNNKIEEVQRMMGSVKDVDMRIITVEKEGGKISYWSALHEAAESGYEKVLEMLLQKNNNKIEEVQKMMGSLEDVDMRIVTVEKIGAKTPYWSVLYEAAESGYEKVAEMLLQKNNRRVIIFDVDLKDKHDCTALHLSSNEGHKRIVELLISNNLTGNYDYTALHVASEKNLVGIVKLLIGNNCDVDLKDEAGKSALHLASERGHSEVVKLLVDKNCDVNLRDDYNSTALHLASIRGRAEVVEMLLSKKALVDAEDFWEGLLCIDVPNLETRKISERY